MSILLITWLTMHSSGQTMDGNRLILQPLFTIDIFQEMEDVIKCTIRRAIENVFVSTY